MRFWLIRLRNAYDFWPSIVFAGIRWLVARALAWQLDVQDVAGADQKNSGGRDETAD